jgi:hypothetical protein
MALGAMLALLVVGWLALVAVLLVLIFGDRR